MNLRLWNREAFGEIASVVGIRIKLDEPTANETGLSYTKILVEIKSIEDMPNEVYINMHNGENIIQKIEHEWILPRCMKCSWFGHITEICSSKLVWKEKTNIVNASREPQSKNSRKELVSANQEIDIRVNSLKTDNSNVHLEGFANLDKKSISEKIYYFEKKKDLGLNKADIMKIISDDEQSKNTPP